MCTVQYESAFLHPLYVEALHVKIDDERTQEMEYYDPFLTQVASVRSGDTVPQMRRRRSAEAGSSSDQTQGPESESVHPFGAGGNTCHSVVVDAHGTAVTFTNSARCVILCGTSKC